MFMPQQTRTANKTLYIYILSGVSILLSVINFVIIFVTVIQLIKSNQSITTGDLIVYGGSLLFFIWMAATQSMAIYVLATFTQTNKHEDLKIYFWVSGIGGAAFSVLGILLLIIVFIVGSSEFRSAYWLLILLLFFYMIIYGGAYVVSIYLLLQYIGWIKVSKYDNPKRKG